MKTLTRKQLEARKSKAVRFLRDVQQDDDRADEIEDESLEDYAVRRRIQILNPKGGPMAIRTQTREELQKRIRELEGENESLQDQLDAIADIVVPASEEDDEGQDEEEDEN